MAVLGRWGSAVGAAAHRTTEACHVVPPTPAALLCLAGSGLPCYVAHSSTTLVHGEARVDEDDVADLARHFSASRDRWSGQPFGRLGLLAAD